MKIPQQLFSTADSSALPQPSRGASGLNSVTSLGASSALSGAALKSAQFEGSAPHRHPPTPPCPLTTVPVRTEHLIFRLDE